MAVLTTLDYIVMVLILAGGVWGALKGFIEEISQKFGYVAGFVCALAFTQKVSPIFVDKLGFAPWLATFLSYVIIFILGYILVKIIGNILQKATEDSALGVVDNVLGFVLGFFEVTLLLGAVDLLFSYQTLFDVSWASNAWIVVNWLRPCISFAGKAAGAIV